MQEILIRKLHEFARDNHPDLLVTLEQENRVTSFLHENVSAIDNLLNELVREEKPAHIIEERCMEELIKQFPPSRFNYLKALLEDEFPAEAERMQKNGILKTELINLIAVCKPLFDELNFSEENEDSRNLHYAIRGAVEEYFNVMSE